MSVPREFLRDIARTGLYTLYIACIVMNYYYYHYYYYHHFYYYLLFF